MDTEMADVMSQMEINVNYDCLQHLIPFLTPKNWVDFAQVAGINNIAALGKDAEEIRYHGVYSETPFEDPDVERLEFAEFMEIFKLIAPNLKYAKFKRNRDFRKTDSDVCVVFGRFVYTMRVKKAEEEELMVKTFLKEAKNVRKLKVNTFNGGTTLEWDQFFQSNPLEYFQFLADNEQDSYTFFNTFISILPSKIQQLGLIFSKSVTDEQEQRIIQLLKKLPVLTKVHFSQGRALSLAILTEVANHTNTLTELCIRHRLDEDDYDDFYDDDIEDEDFDDEPQEHEILSLISTFTNLTKLSLAGFDLDLHEDLCRQIAANCKAIRCLKLLYSYSSGTCLRELISLPNLAELHMNHKPMTFPTQVIGLKKLVISHFFGNDDVDTEILANALAFMPSLTSLSFEGVNALTESAARTIKQVVQSRGQNISVYTFNCIGGVIKNVTEKLGEVALVANSNREFSILLRPRASDDPQSVLELFASA